MMNQLNDVLIENAVSYAVYRKTLDELIAQGKTTGPNQDEWLVDYARLNIQRMNRWDKTWQVPEKLEQELLKIEQPMIWLTITEGWCGDAAQVVPIIEKLAAVNPMIQHKLILRDENPEIIDQFLTNGTRSIPKIIVLDGEALTVIGTWGPRPSSAQALLDSLKTNQELPKEELYNQLHAWYAKNKGVETAEEFMQVLRELN
ncbi:thioredoxin family protein [Flavihumibacter sp. CACIAM 22H1]|uniref:thioredoxin family protein n=1 Tax=Flavihumibacter sp. CACIAM 22H1 TaxID=1812911 RepID=UPI0007A8A23C|nr:thioredoxin family protein [Flavihumibacter sp. CACIAM 22H1]KYP13727.1 MAG: hypothetical protein A1D16_04460 [Flavihumibacter sp. CACIAM 22H1]